MPPNSGNRDVLLRTVVWQAGALSTPWQFVWSLFFANTGNASVDNYG